MKRVVYVHHNAGIGGASMSLLYLLRKLDRGQYTPVVVMLGEGPLVSIYRAEGIEVHALPYIQDYSHTALEWYGGPDLWRLPFKSVALAPSVLAAYLTLSRLQPDIVHLNASPLAAWAIAARRLRLPLVWHIREPLNPGYTGLRRQWLRRTVERCASRVIAISRYDAQQLVPSAKVEVIYNFVDFAHFDRGLSGAAVREEFGIPEGAPLILMLGGVAHPKGTLVLAEAFEAIHQALPEAYLLIAGHGLPARSVGVKAAVKALLRTDAYGMQVQAALDALPTAARARIIFTGVRRDVPSLLAAADLLVFPSVVPHFARPIIEAAAMGKPAVASDLGGPQELIVPGETGLLVPSADPQALAAAVIRLVTEPGLARAMGQAAYERALTLFDADQNAGRTIALYAELA